MQQKYEQEHIIQLYKLIKSKWKQTGFIIITKMDKFRKMIFRKHKTAKLNLHIEKN